MVIERDRSDEIGIDAHRGVMADRRRLAPMGIQLRMMSVVNQPKTSIR